MKKFKLNISMLTIILVSLVLGVTSCKKDEDVALSAITLDQVQLEVELNANELLSVVFSPSDATFKDLVWTSSDNDIATVAGGMVHGVALGTATITATSIVNPAIKATCEVTVVPFSGQVFTISGDITENQTWYGNAKYKLDGFVYVKNNATLTIEPGTIITGVVDSKGSLIVERGSKIMAQGTLAEPIVFTSDKAVGQRAAGDWGGLVLCGNAKTNKADDGVGVGIAEGGIGSRYGGTNDDDNSGVLQYVRIEFAGIALTATANSEINGLTLYAVGKGTTIDHIQISYSGDDSYEWFGGTVNCKYLVAYRGLDDDFDTDNGFTGTVQFITGIRDVAVADQSSSNGFESDNDAAGSTTEPFTAPIFCNVTLFGPSASSADAPHAKYQSAMHIRRGSRLSVYNSLFIGWPSGLRIDGGSGNSPAQADANVLQVENCILSLMTANYANVAAGYTDVQSEAYYTSVDPARNNSVDAANIYGGLLDLATPSFIPAGGSAWLTTGSFTNARLSGNTFLTNVAYRGAFGATDWTAGWCNFDPKNTAY